MKNYFSDEDVARFLGTAVREAVAGESAMSHERIKSLVAALDHVEAMSPAQRALAFTHVGAVALSALCAQAKAANQAHKVIFQHNSRERTQ